MGTLRHCDLPSIFPHNQGHWQPEKPALDHPPADPPAIASSESERSELESDMSEDSEMFAIASARRRTGQ